MAEDATNRFVDYKGFDFILPESFKNEVKEINKNKINYNKYSAIIETRGVHRGALNIYMPNQWFYIASYFTAFYNELQKYKSYALKVATKERLKELNGSNLSFYEQTYLDSLEISSTSKKYLKQFITDYQWWGGAKTIDRGDFYVSPILTYASLVNASQSFVADLCAFLADKPLLCASIINEVETYNIESHVFLSEANNPLQIIYYGAPGTGKSHGIDTETKGKSVIRTTFHPDSDYSTFVGAYKPIMMERPVMTILGKEQIPVKKQDGTPAMESRIEYEYVPQAFVQAYIKAWKDLSNPIYLVIEEINRGNCAQIFGDLFQLLDRKDDGYSSYEIVADMDLQHHLAKEFAKGIDANAPEYVKSGEKLCLPKNLFIWATMNTSDQSLFPIDSAFKRRWDWKYVPIDTHKEEWSIEVNGSSYDWGSFLDRINEEIEYTTSSEDKKLGFYFCKAEDDVISADKFISKVLFYIYNDVFKDYGFDSREFFKDKDTQKPIRFQSFYQMNGEVNDEQVEKILKNLGVETSANVQLERSEEDQKKDGKHDFLSAVTIGDEKLTLENRTHFQLYMDTLKKIGLDKVFPIISRSKYKRVGCPLASFEKDERIESHKNFSYVQEGGYYFIKGAADETLINVLKEIDAELNLGLDIEIYR